MFRMIFETSELTKSLNEHLLFNKIYTYMRSIVFNYLRRFAHFQKKHIISEELGYYSNEIETESVAIVCIDDQSYDYSCLDVEFDLT